MEGMEEKTALEELLRLEDVAEKKGKIYSRLLIDTTLAQAMERLALRHEQRKEKLSALLTGGKRKEKEEKKNEA